MKVVEQVESATFSQIVPARADQRVHAERKVRAYSRSSQCTCSAHALYVGVGVPRCVARVRSVGRLTPSLRLRHRCPEDHRRAAAGRCHLLLERLSQQVDVGRLHPDLCCGRSRHAQCRGARRQQWPTHPQRWNAQVKREHHRVPKSGFKETIIAWLVFCLLQAKKRLITTKSVSQKERAVSHTKTGRYRPPSLLLHLLHGPPPSCRAPISRARGGAAHRAAHLRAPPRRAGNPNLALPYSLTSPSP